MPLLYMPMISCGSTAARRVRSLDRNDVSVKKGLDRILRRIQHQNQNGDGGTVRFPPD